MKPVRLTPVSSLLVWLIALVFFLSGRVDAAESAKTATEKTIRVAAVQAKPHMVPFRSTPAEALAVVDNNLAELEALVTRAAAEKCDALCFPEDTPGLLNWLGVNEASLPQVLPEAVRRMLDRLGRAAARHQMYLVVCSDFVEADGGVYNTAFFLGRDGKEIGRYHKVCPAWGEAGARKRGASFPVFPTGDLGGVGMLICYDLVIPETARCLALNGADLIFFPTMGGAAIGDDDIGVQALRVRAVENFVWLVVAHRGAGAMIISPQGKIVARAEGPDGFAIADINPFGGREGGDALNAQRDMRARLFRERNPAAFSVLTEASPPVLAKVPIHLSAEETARVAARVLTLGEEEFKAADQLRAAGKTNEAIEAFARLRREYRDSWIDRVSRERLAKLQGDAPQTAGGAAIEPPARTTLSDPGIKFTVPEKPYVVLRRGPLEAVIVDNRAVDDAVLPGHRAGYHGVASLRHENQPRNLFVPAYAGLNFEHIHDGTVQPREVLFEPRHAPIHLRAINAHTAELHQPPTPHWGLESCQRYELLENGAIELTFECIPRRDTYKNGYIGLFWASYIHQPESLDVHFIGRAESEPGEANWIRGVTPKHGIFATHRALGDAREFKHDAAFPLELPFGFSRHRYAEPWFFGECRGMALAQLFREKDQARLTQSPSGGGQGNPAWDFQWFISNPRIGQRYQFVMRAFYAPLPQAEERAARNNRVREALRSVELK